MTDASPQPGALRVTSASPHPTDTLVEVLQVDGTWLPLLSLTGVIVIVNPNDVIRAVVTVLPSSVDVVTIPERARPSLWERLRERFATVIAPAVSRYSGSRR